MYSTPSSFEVVSTLWTNSELTTEDFLFSSTTTSIWPSEQFTSASEQIHETTEWNEIVNPETELPTEDFLFSSTTTSIWPSEQFTSASEQIHETTEWNEIVNPETELTTEIYSTPSTFEIQSTLGTINCLYTLDFDVKDNIVSFLESSGVQSLNFNLKTENDGCNELHEYVELEILPESVTATLYQDFNASNDTIIASSSSYLAYNFTILDDELVEPFEFFVLKIRVLSSTIPLNSLTVPDFVYIYIQDDDYNEGQKDSKIFNIFAPEIANSDFFSAFYTDSALTNVYPVENNQALFTDQGGFSIPFPNINIVVENTGIVSYKLHSVEVNNPEVCNIDSFTIRRKRFFDDPFLDNFELKSISLNGVAFVDVDFNKFAFNLGSSGDDLQRMDIKVLSTKNGNNINKCEFRAFAEAN
ncbi:hypothetical protein BpHYR1_035381 [Brachionus plicatilis]|uniref:Calx-beta domain-containing protein n=1 Tax=Brachionus plicatilis TaxID=10195 RepID=A0A3M7RLY4_BRAPC|nr:hypothetical protein BpHYR1_035381 [Brachionus plicatilis]